MPESELYRRGAEIRRELMGVEYAARRDAATHSDPATRKFIDTVTELVFGGLWTRPGLDLKTRALVTLVADAATGMQELDVHLRMAMRQGWTEEEITEVFLHLLGYVGAPLTRQAFQRAQPVFEEFRQGASR